MSSRSWPPIIPIEFAVIARSCQSDRLVRRSSMYAAWLCPRQDIAVMPAVFKPPGHSQIHRLFRVKRHEPMPNQRFLSGPKTRNERRSATELFLKSPCRHGCRRSRGKSGADLGHSPKNPSPCRAYHSVPNSLRSWNRSYQYASSAARSSTVTFPLKILYAQI